MVWRERGNAPESGRALCSLARWSLNLATAQPALALALLLEPAAWSAYLEHAPPSRIKAQLQESALPRIVWSPGATEPSFPEVGLEHPFRLAEDRSAADPADAEAADRARSAAERLLFERLESLPETAGVFQLNATLDFHFGPHRSMEIDLAAPSLMLALEIDGYYHFQDAGSYRRDRRKDLELQQRGYVVVRVLAEDVVGRLEEVLETIRAAVAFRRHEALR